MENIQRALDLAAKQRITPTHPHVHLQPHGEDPAVAERSAVRREFTPAPVEPATRLAVNWSALRDSRIIDRADAGPAAEAYRMLRTQVLQRARAHGISTIGIVSAVNGEGKTLTAINLSLSLAAEPEPVGAAHRFGSAAAFPWQKRCACRWSADWNPGLPARRRLEELWHGVEGVERACSLLPTLVPVAASSEVRSPARRPGSCCRI